MRQIPKKNYIILVILIVITVLLTFILFDIYRNKDKVTSDFYRYSNKITNEEFDEYILESSDLIIYISDKYDLANQNFENKFKNKIDSLNLKNKLIFIDKEELNSKFLNELKNKYGLNINLNELPIIIVIIDKKIIKTVKVEYDSDVNSIIEYEVFE